MRILLVEDEPDLAQATAAHLVAGGHVVDHAASLEEGQAAVQVQRYDLILLDLQLPDGDGLTLLRGLRAQPENGAIPVLILTARDRIMERIAGLEAGADDYMVKPFDLDEMLARINAIRRRLDRDGKPELRLGDIRILPTEMTVYRGDRPVTLTRKEWALLERISRRPGVVVSKPDLEDALYGFGDEVESNAIEVHVSRLRAKLGRSVIETVRGFGYRIGSA
jgi:two-component system OmpR family response regulator